MTNPTNQHLQNLGSFGIPKQGAKHQERQMAKNTSKTTRKRSASAKRDIQQEVADKIIEMLEAGTKPWEKPWQAGPVCLPLRANSLPYRGINIVILWMSANANGYTSPYWMTYRQAAALGGQVRGGEKGTGIIKYGTYEKKDAGEEPTADSEEDTTRRYLRAYTVFNADQIDGLAESFYPKVAPIGELNQRIRVVDDWLTTVGATVVHGGDRACYLPAPDAIRMPEFNVFRDSELYYSTLQHELIHWTRHPERLNRDFGCKKWGDEGYALEELAAEFGSCFLGAIFGFRPDHIDRHASYIASWSKAIRNDKRFLFTACAHAQKAVDFLDPPMLDADDKFDQALPHAA